MKKSKNTRIISYISGTRADFGLMSGVLSEISRDPVLDLDLCTIGMHTMPAFGYTHDEVQKMFPGVQKIPIGIADDSREALGQYFSACIQGVLSLYIRKRPDFALVLGDRAEMLAVCCACHYLSIPVGHIHGGDITGTIDEVTRHAITKLSHIHFPATHTAKQRIQRMGEEPWRIHVVGTPSIDRIMSKQHIPKADVYKFLCMPLSQAYILVTIHPDSFSLSEDKKHILEVIAALKRCALPAVVIYPNADPGSSVIIAEIEKVRQNPLFRIYQSISYEMFLEIERHASVWVGNSSAGIIESASFHTPVVNIGTRQDGREKAKNVIDVPFDKILIEKAIRQSLTDDKFLRMIAAVRNPWGDGKTANRIVEIIRAVPLDSTLINKKFITA